MIKKMAVISLFFVWVISHANTVIEGKVVRVLDGDTIELIHEIKCKEADCKEIQNIRVRLAEIDAPESGQPYGYDAKQMLADLIFNKIIRVEIINTDRYGRAIGQIWIDKIWINGEMVKEGGAWAYLKYLEHPILIEYQEQARIAKVGLWALQADQIMPPWQYRKLK